MSTQLLAESESEVWDRFVSETENATLFHTHWWHQAWGLSPRIYVRKDQDAKIEAGLLLHVRKFFGVKAVLRPPLTPRNGPIFCAARSGNRSSRYVHFKKEMLSAIESLPRLGFYDFILRPCDTDVMPFLWNGYDTQVTYTYVIPKEECTWQRNMSSTQKRNLRKARKELRTEGCAIETNPPFDDVKFLLLETARLKGYSMEGYSDQMSLWWEVVQKRGAGRLYLVRDTQGNAVCATVLVWDSHTAYYLGGGIRAVGRQKTHLNYLLFERMIHDAHDMGRDFDFEGSILPGVERFFRAWGGQLRPAYRVVKTSSILSYLGWMAYRYFKYHRPRNTDITKGIAY